MQIHFYVQLTCVISDKWFIAIKIRLHITFKQILRFSILDVDRSSMQSVSLCFKSNDTHIWSRLSFLLSRCNAWQLRNQKTTHARSPAAIIKWSKLQVVSTLGEKQKSEQNTRAHFPCVACPPILAILTKGKTWIIIWPPWSISLISRFCVSLPNQRTINYNFVRNKTLHAFIV